MIRKFDVGFLRELIEQGLSDAEIEDVMSEVEAESREAQDFELNAYGPEDDMRSPYEAQMQDRLDMGRNDAGEWLGFM